MSDNTATTEGKPKDRSAYFAEYRARPGIKEKRNKYDRDRYQIPEIRAKIRKKQDEYQKTPGYKSCQKTYRENQLKTEIQKGLQYA